MYVQLVYLQELQTFGIGVSGGKHVIDKNCERLKLARILNDFGMKVAAVAILCQDERVFESMIQAGNALSNRWVKLVKKLKNFGLNTIMKDLITIFM